jgi:aminoglycoside 2''-phosphotransferase
MPTAVQKNEFMDKTKRYLDRIHSHYPSLQLITARLNDQGQSNDGLIVNEEFIFRFPKNLQALQQIQAEFEILRLVQGHTTLRIPNPICSYTDTDTVGEAFIGYRLIPGEPFLRDTFLSIREEAIVDRLADQVATFLMELHGLEFDSGLDLDVPRRDTREEWVGLLTGIREALLPKLSREESLLVIEDLETFLVDDGNFEYSPVLRHGDFGSVNVLYDPSGKRLSGVIDFGNAGVGDPALDLAAVMAPTFGYGEEFVSRMGRNYPIDDALLGRARFYLRTFALQEALYGIEHGSERIFREGLKDFFSQLDSRTGIQK